MPSSTKKGIFCLECDWWGIKDRTTVKPVLRLLHSFSGTRAPYIHRDVATTEEFWYYVDKWSQKGFKKYQILYLGFHGDENVLQVGEKKGGAGDVTLDELAERLKGKCKKRIIHFGSCGTLALHGAKINTFLKTTGAAAVCGYRTDVPWLESTCFEALLLGLMQDYTFTKQGLQAIQRRLKENAPGLMKNLEFRLKLAPS